MLGVFGFFRGVGVGFSGWGEGMVVVVGDGMAVVLWDGMVVVFEDGMVVVV